MNRVAIGLLGAVVLGTNIVTIALLLDRPDAAPSGRVDVVTDDGGTVTPLLEAIDALRGDVERLSRDVATRSALPAETSAPSRDDDSSAAFVPAETLLSARFDAVTERLDRIESTLTTMRDANEEVAAAQLREQRQEQFRAEDGYVLADELLAQKQYAVGANGILSFLEAHPDHPDARDLMRKACDAFRDAGYGEKALWVQNEMLKRYPESRGEDLYSLAMLEKRLRRIDDAFRSISESVDLATTVQTRMNRMFYRAYLIHERDGDAAGLAAYREVEQTARAAGISNPADEAGRRANEIEERVARR